MFMSRLALTALTIAAALAAHAADTPNLGEPATADEIAAWDIAVGPTGDELPPGSGTARLGADLFAENCEACHGPGGEDGMHDRLVGGQGTLASNAPIRTVGSYWPYATTLFDYIRRAMPYTAPQSLSDDEVYALSAYLLNRNGIIGEDDEMNADTLPLVEMPNRDGFVSAWPPGH